MDADPDPEPKRQPICYQDPDADSGRDGVAHSYADRHGEREPDADYRHGGEPHHSRRRMDGSAEDQQRRDVGYQSGLGRRDRHEVVCGC